MRDRILASYTTDFITEQGLLGLSESEAFERFASFCVISKHHPDAFDVEQTCVGGSGDLAIDAAALIVNEHLVTSEEEVDYFKNALKRLDVRFVFIQAKTTSHFETSDLTSFSLGVRRFFSPECPDGVNASLASLYHLKEYIYDSSIDMDRSPLCRLYYVTTGSWQAEAPLVAAIDQVRKDLMATELFSSVEFEPIDAEALKALYRQLKHKVTREILFEKHTILPAMGGVQEAYIGILPCQEYLKLALDDDGTLNRRIFYDNVRDYQGNNAVNREIVATLRDAKQNDRFALLNNGVTIVARDLSKIGAKFRLKDYQVVNGCQTTHVLVEHKRSLTDNIYLPVKLVVTSDAEVINQVIQGTNRQTEVTLEALRSLAPFQKKLEEFYAAVGRDRRIRLLYERRSKQYEQQQLQRHQVVSLATQTKCFIAMFLNEPHSTHRYYGELLRSYEGRLFLDSHSPMPYFVSGAAFATLETILRGDEAFRDMRQLRYQLLMVFRLLEEGDTLPYLNSRKIEDYCDVLAKKLDDAEESRRAFERAVALVREELASVNKGAEHPSRTRAFTGALISRAGAKAEIIADVGRERGRVEWFSAVRGYGFVTPDQGGDKVFIHYTAVQGRGFSFPKPGEMVEFTRIKGPKGWQGESVVLL
jgi:cold shock CspA family protein